MARLPGLILLASALLPLPGCSTATPTGGGSSRSALDASLRSAVDDAGLAGAAFVVLGRSGEIYRSVVGDIRPDSAVRVASASKWVAAAVLMSVVESGQLSLETRVADKLPDYPPEVGGITLRQLMSHSSGIDPDLALRQPVIGSLEVSARHIASQPLQAAPGSRFSYGGSSMQIAARMAEAATGRSWQALYETALARPLGIRGSWGHPLREDDPVPYVAGGLRISMNDYARFLAMMLSEGRHGAKRVLRASSVRQIETDQIAAVSDVVRPAVVPGKWRYGVGVWCERVRTDGVCSLISSAGAFGVFPWIDRDAGRAGLFFTQAPLPKVLPAALRLRELSKSLPSQAGSRQ